MAKAFEQCRVCRRAGTKLYLKGERCYTPKCALIRRNYPPGVAGARPGRRSRLTSYGIQLREKQKARSYYGLMEGQFSRYFHAASSKAGNTSDHFYTLLEGRIDNVIYRLGWAWSRKDARQKVSHGAFFVNGRRVTVPSYQVRIGDVVSLAPSQKSSKHYQELIPSLEKHKVPEWLSSESSSAFEAKIVSMPTQPEETSVIFNMKSIVEFYSR